MFVALEDNLCLKREERQIHLQEGGKKTQKPLFGFKIFLTLKNDTYS